MDSKHIRRHLDISISHITERDSALLERDAVEERNPDGYDMPDQPVVPCSEYEYGFFVMVLKHHEDEEDQNMYLAELLKAGYSVQFCYLLKLAWQHDADVIRLDRDAEECDDLPTFEW